MKCSISLLDRQTVALFGDECLLCCVKVTKERDDFNDDKFTLQCVYLGHGINLISRTSMEITQFCIVCLLV